MRRTLARLDRHLLLIYGLLALVIWSAYGSAVLYDYAWTDDYAFLYAVHARPLTETMQLFFNQQGRPLGGVILKSAFMLAGSLGHLKWVRLADLGLVLVCGLILFAEIRRVVPAWIGLGAVSLMLLNPAISVCVGWPSNGLLSLPAAVLALSGGVLWLRTVERDGPREAGFWLRAGVAGGLLLAALATYQPSACFFLLPAAIRWLDDDSRRALRTSTWTAGGCLLGCTVYFVAFRILRPYLEGAHPGATPRAELVADISGRVRFFVFDIARRSFESWAVFFGPAAQGAILLAGVALTVIFLVHFTRTLGGRTARLHAWLLVLVFFGLGASPLLVVKDSYAPFRTLPVLYGFVALGVAGGIRALWRWLPANRYFARTAVAALWGALLLANCVAACYVTTEGFVLPNVREMDLYRRFVHHRMRSYPAEVVFVLAEPQRIPRFSRIAAYHEFGTPSSVVEWTYEGLLCSVLNEEHRRALPNQAAPAGWQVVIHKVQAGGQTLFPADLPVIDASQVLDESWMESEASRSGPVMHDKYFGDVQQLTATMRLSGWLGLYEVVSPTRINHRDLGELDVTGPGGGDCWFHREGLGWFWTSPAVFPRIYSSDRKHWLRYVRGTKEPAKFYDTDAPGQPLIRIE